MTTAPNTTVGGSANPGEQQRGRQAMTGRTLDRLLSPGSIALVGSDMSAESSFAILARNLVNGGFHGALSIVCAEESAVEGVPTVREIAALPGLPDLAVIAASPGATIEHIVELGARGIGTAIVAGTGFNWPGARRAQGSTTVSVARLRAAGHRSGVRILGPGSLGLADPSRGLNGTTAPQSALPGDLALVSGSSGVLTAALDWATTRGIGFSRIVGLGGAVDVGIADVLHQLAVDTKTAGILLHLEAVTDGRRFIAAARAAARVKPVVVLKGGRSRDDRADAILSGKPDVGADAVHDAAFARAGLVRVDDIADLFAAAALLSGGPAPWTRALRGDRMAIVGNSRSVGLLAVDGLVAAGGRLATRAVRRGRPKPALLDLGGAADGERYAEAIESLRAEPGVDSVLAIHSPSAAVSATDTARALAGLPPPGNVETPVLAAWLGNGPAARARDFLRDVGIPAWDDPDEAIRAALRLARFHHNQSALLEAPPSRPENVERDLAGARRIIERLHVAPDRQASGQPARALLAIYGIPVAAGQAGLRRMRGASALRLDLAVRQDAAFGPAILFGLRGSPVERAVLLPPLNLALARAAVVGERSLSDLAEASSSALSKVVDEVTLLLVKIAQIVVDHPELAELTVDPLIVDSDGVAALDGDFRVDDGPRGGRPRLSLQPYPSDLETTLVLAGGKQVFLRPIRPADRAAFQAVFTRLPAEDVRMRFMSPLKRLSSAMAARLTQPDYDQEIALVAFEREGADAASPLGVVRLHIDDDGRAAEFAVIVLPDGKRQGLGRKLVERIIDYGRERGVAEIYGEVLSENTAMLALCRGLGFALTVQPDEPGVIRVALPLRQRKKSRQT